MEQGYKHLVIFLAAVVLGAGVLLTLGAYAGEQSPDISYIDDIDQFCLEQDIPIEEDSGIQYVQLDANRVFVLDQRNSDEFLYVHSEIEASVDRNGTLIVHVTDTTAVSENDISGTYAVLITSKQDISKTEIEQEKKSG